MPVLSSVNVSGSHASHISVVVYDVRYRRCGPVLLLCTPPSVEDAENLDERGLWARPVSVPINGREYNDGFMLIS